MKGAREPDLLPARPAASLASAIALAFVAAVAAVAWAALALAHAGRHAPVPVGLLAGLGLAGWAAWLVREQLSRCDRAALRRRFESGGQLVPAATGAAVAALAAGIFFPGFPWAVADRDPGVYLAHAAQIARTGDFALTDPVVDPANALVWADPFGHRDGERRFPGYWIQSREERRVVSQFYALYPALLATAIDAGGLRAAVAVNPALAGLGAVLLFLLVRAAAGGAAGLAAAVLLAVQMIEVWQAKYPTAEIVTQLFLLGATLALLVARELDSAALGALAGALVALTFATRPDGLLIVALAWLGGLAWHLAGPLPAAGRGLWAGLLATLPHALLQGFHPRFNRDYSLGQGLPPAAALAVVALGTVALALAVRGRARDRLARAVASLRRHGGVALVAAATFLLALGYLRPWLFGPDSSADGNRSYNEESLLRLTWFFTPRGMLLLWLGVGVAGLTSLRRRPAIWLLAAPALVLLPLFLYDPRIDPGLMWWVRRYVPYTLPGMVALVAIGLAALAAWGVGSGVPAGAGAERARGPGAGARRGARLLVALLALAVGVDLLRSWATMSLPLRRHPEMRGALELIDEVGRLAPGRRAVVLWHSARHTGSPGFSFAAPVWAYHDQVSALLPFDASAQEARHYAEVFRGSPLFLVSDDAPPPALAALPFVFVRHFEVALPMWEESVDFRPAKSRLRRFNFKVWRLADGGLASSTAPPRTRG